VGLALDVDLLAGLCADTPFDLNGGAWLVPNGLALGADAVAEPEGLGLGAGLLEGPEGLASEAEPLAG